MPTLGTDCDITLNHASVNGGLDYGFLLYPRRQNEGVPVTIQRKVDSSSTTVDVWVYFNIICGDNLTNPDGSTNTDTRANMYSKLTDFLNQRSGITLTMVSGVIMSLGCLGYSATEEHFDYAIITAVQLNNAGTYYPPIDATTLSLCVWDGTLTWSTSYWR